MSEPIVKPFDFDRALREMASYRRRRDHASLVQVQLADRLATHAAAEFGPEAVEAAGMGMVLGASMIAELLREGLENPVLLVNALSLIGERLVRDGRTFGGAS